MAKFKDFLPGIGEGLLTSIEKQRDRKAALQDAIALLMASPENQAKQYAMQTIQQQNPEPTMRISSTNPPSPEMRSRMDTEFQGMQKNRSSRILEAMSAHGLLPKAPLTLEDIFAKAQMQAAGSDAGRGPSRRPAPQGLTTAISSTANAIARMQELEQFLGTHPDLQTGPHVFQLKRGGVGGAVGNLQLQYATDPNTAKAYTELNKMSNQTQDAYRSAVTGSAAGFPEIRFLQTSIATPEREVRNNYQTSLTTTRQEAQQKLNQMVDALDAAGYDSTEFRQRFASFLGETGGTGGGTVAMQDRTGKTYQIPSDRVQEATADGLQPIGR